MFRDREDAALQLAECLKGCPFEDPLVLAIPRGGVVVGAVLARELGADLDVVLTRRLRAPGLAETSLGAVSEAGQVYLVPEAGDLLLSHDYYLTQERARQLGEIAWRKKQFRGTRPPAAIAGRSVIVTDDGIATGATMIAALQSLRPQHPAKIIVAVPVAPPDKLEEVARWGDEVVCLQAPHHFLTVGQFYDNFGEVDDQQVAHLLQQSPAFARSEQMTGRHAVGRPFE
jgi:predicted phosphoribosyltransferase